MVARFNTAVLLSSLVTVGLAPVTSAQTCAGALSFNFAPLQVGGAARLSPDGKSAAASVGAGSDRLFGAFSTGVSFDSRVAHAALAVGTDQALTLDNRLHLCPVATVGFARREGSAVAGPAGHVTLGWVARNATDVIIVPSVAFGVRPVLTTAADARPRRYAAEVQAAIGFILRGRMALTPRVAFARRQPTGLALELTFDAR